jgi:hypothetical protein
MPIVKRKKMISIREAKRKKMISIRKAKNKVPETLPSKIRSYPPVPQT